MVLRLRVESAVRELIESAAVLVNEGAEEWRHERMVPNDRGYYVSIDVAPYPHVVLYAFQLNLSNGERAYYVPRADGRATAGALVFEGVDGTWTDYGWRYWDSCFEGRPREPFGLPDFLPGFQITVYDPSFATPEWLAGSIMYQIFPDRFARGAGGVRAEGVSYHESMSRPLHLHESWNEPVEWLGEPTSEQLAEWGEAARAEVDDVADEPAGGSDGDGAFADDADEIPEGASASESASSMGKPPWSDTPDKSKDDPDFALVAAMRAYDPIDFFGGTLAGIREKLPYLASLGVEVLYLNPIFEARSNHRYDTADYEHIEPLLGSDEDFERLTREAAEHGISIVLDAVLSHTGNDSRYFDALGTYEVPGAMQDEQSPFRAWYDFTPQANGVPYRCWWGDCTLPEVDECNPAWQDYILGHPGCGDGVLARWLAAGARGYRLDVADELPDGVLERIRATVKAAKSDAVIIGEVWEDPTTKLSYGARRTYALGRSLDTVMNYPLRSALLGFALDEVDAHQLAAFLKLQQANYAPPFYRCLMNLLSSHDVERMRSALVLDGALKNVPRNVQFDLVEAITPEQDARAARLQRMIVALMYALPGAPCIYYGDERGMQGGSDPFCRATFPWDGPRADSGEDLTAFYQHIGALRKGSSVLREGVLACAAAGEDAVCIVRTMPDGHVALAVANRADSDRCVAFDLRSLGVDSIAGDLDFAFCSEEGERATARVEDGLVTVCVPACATVLFLQK